MYLRLLRAVVLLAAVAPVAHSSVWQPAAVLPPTSGAYVTAAGERACYDLFDAVCLSEIRHGAFTNVISAFLGGDQYLQFDSTFTAVLTRTCPGCWSGPVYLSGPVEWRVLNRSGADQTGTFQVELLSFSLSGSGMSLREDQSRSSTGSTTVTDVGGEFRIDSFFDVFTELDLDDDELSWLPSNASTRTELQAKTPEPGALALMFAGALGLALARRRYSTEKR